MKFSGFHSSQRVGLGMEVISSSPYVTTPASLLTLKSQGTAPILASQRTGASTIEQFVLVQTEGSAYTAASGTSSGTWTNIIENKNSNLMLTTYLAGGTGGSIILDGNVGIGTTGPSYKTDIYSAADIGLRVYGQGSADGGILLQRSSSYATIRYNAARLDFHLNSTGNDPKMVILNDGNVGIGIIAPVHALHVYSTTTVHKSPAELLLP